ncbi:roadblock/LC7 domain-containing protein [Streptomyces sp. NPDC093510]|uniref:roadblock/LC7 domain-containing protein n=1 Tax=Streptomyces sp. NPDC093510 TaxID=3155199 RepID=UPI003443715B
MTTPTAPPIDWLLQNFVNKTRGVRSTLVTSNDGLLISQVNLGDHASGLADVLSALASGVHSLAKGASKRLGSDGVVDQALIQMGDTSLLVMEAGSGALLTVVSEPGADIGQIHYEMALLAKQVPGSLSVPARQRI